MGLRRQEMALSSCVRRTRGPAGIPGTTPTGFSPLSLSSDLWFKADAGTFQTVAGTAATADADPVGQYLDNSANANHASQATSTKRLTLNLNIANGLPMLLADGVDDYLKLGSAIALTGAFTVYAVGTRSAASKWIPLGREAGGSAFLSVYSDNNIFFRNDAGTDATLTAYTGATGTIIARFRRDASNVCKFAATGMAEATIGTLSGTFTLDTLCAAVSLGQFNSGINKHGELVVKAADVLTDTPALDASMLAYLASRWGVTLP